jgi:hypothetical protein
MADLPISGLPAATTPLAGTEELPIVQAGETRRATVNSIPSLLFTSKANFSTNNNTTTLGQTLIYACIDSAVDRTLTLSSADIATASSTNVWKFIVNDETGTLVANGTKITVDTEGAETIDGAASVDIIADYGTVRLYSNGSNLFSY